MAPAHPCDQFNLSRISSYLRGMVGCCSTFRGLSADRIMLRSKPESSAKGRLVMKSNFPLSPDRKSRRRRLFVILNEGPSR